VTSQTTADFRVLAVDDEDGIREFVARVLRQPGYEVTVASDGDEAIQVAEADGPFDLLVTDLMMPRMRGDELARRLRLAVPELKVLYLTGFADSLFEQRALLWEDEAFLDKPVSVQGLLEAAALLLVGRVPAPRAARVRISGARVQVGDHVAPLESVSINGGLIHVPTEMPVGSTWPLALQLPGDTLRVNARVVNCRPADASVPASATSPVPYSVAFAFVDLSASARQVLQRAIADAIAATPTA
jgi:CheY-like chemotaxis protein